jgi:hypothetical protein
MLGKTELDRRSEYANEPDMVRVLQSIVAMLVDVAIPAVGNLNPIACPRLVFAMAN